MRGEQLEWAAFTGRTFSEYHDLGWIAKIHPDDLKDTLSAWEMAIAQRGKFTLEHRVARRDGEWRLCKVIALSTLSASGAVREWVGTHTDITEQRQADQQVLQAKIAAETANRAKSAFLASISHELRTPLNAIIGYSELMEQELQDSASAPLRADLVKVRNSGKHLLELINDLLDLRKIEAGRMDLYAEQLDIAYLVRDIANTVHPLMQKNGNRLEIKLSSQKGGMYTDRTKLRQCLLNVLSNAAKFTEKGLVEFTAEAAGNDMVFRIRDTGIGIEPHLAANLFEPFS
jgi:PAS domain S-box-containing protein